VALSQSIVPDDVQASPVTGQSVPQPLTERLIEAAMEALPLDMSQRQLRMVAIALLPLIADEIEAIQEQPGLGMLKAAALVRGLAEQLGG
jgi:hypothetical protein